MERFFYQLTIRPVGRDTTPEGVGRDMHDTNVLPIPFAQGSVSYSQPLSLEEIQQYALIPVTEMRAVNGNSYQQAWPTMTVNYRVRLSENLLALQVDSEYKGVRHRETLAWPEFVRRSKNWQQVAAAAPPAIEGAGR